MAMSASDWKPFGMRIEYQAIKNAFAALAHTDEVKFSFHVETGQKKTAWLGTVRSEKGDVYIVYRHDGSGEMEQWQHTLADPNVIQLACDWLAKVILDAWHYRDAWIFSQGLHPFDLVDQDNEACREHFPDD